MTDRESADIVAAGYDALGERYGIWASAVESDPRVDWQAALDGLLPDGARVLDLGCGPGLAAAQLARRFAVVGVDVSATQIALARHAVPGATFRIGDMRSVELDAGSFDAVVALYSLIHFPMADMAPMLARIASWLRPAGLLLATLGTIDGEGVQDDWLGVPMFFGGSTPDRNRELLSRAGFRIRRDEVVTINEPDEGEVAFHWILASRSGRRPTIAS